MKLTDILIEGIHDPSIFKAVFVIGGPGSGKTTITDMLGLKALGFVNINSDSALTYLMTKNQLSLDMPPEEKQERETVRTRAKEITFNRMSNAIDGRLGIYIDGTGEDFNKMEMLNNNLNEIGYETYLVIVHVPLDLALERNRNRTRKVPEEIVRNKWHGVQRNLEKFIQTFPKHIIINNNKTINDVKPQVDNAYKKISKWSKHPVRNDLTRLWFKQQTKIDESIDVEKAYPIETWYTDDETFALVAVAHDDHDRDIEISFTPMHDDINIVAFDFTRGGSYEQTGEGHAGKVFATVMRAFQDYLKSVEPDYVLFASKGHSRTKLYQSIIKRFANKFGYNQINIDDLPEEIIDNRENLPSGDIFVLSKV